MISTLSITDLKQNTSKVIKQLQDNGKSIVILQRSKAAAVLVDPAYFGFLEEAFEDRIDLKAIDDRREESTVSLKEIRKKLEIT